MAGSSSTTSRRGRRDIRSPHLKLIWASQPMLRASQPSLCRAPVLPSDADQPQFSRRPETGQQLRAEGRVVNIVQSIGPVDTAGQLAEKRSQVSCRAAGLARCPRADRIASTLWVVLITVSRVA